METQKSKETTQGDEPIISFLNDTIDALLTPEKQESKEKGEPIDITPTDKTVEVKETEEQKKSIWDEAVEVKSVDQIADEFAQAVAESVQEEIKMSEENVTTIDSETGEVVQEKFSKTFESRQEANNLLDLLDSLGYEDSYETKDGGKTVTLAGVTAEDLSLIQRKANIKLWSDRTQAVATAVTTFATDVADYALNGALAPTAGAVVNAGMTTGRVVATAAVSVGAATLATTIRNGRAAARELARNEDVRGAWNEVKGLGSDIGGLLFGSKGGSKSSWTTCA